jgi:cytochrome c oxidase assembly protein subunit 15
MARSPSNPWLHRFACFTAANVLALIALGGNVTSNGAGLAVPDWPTVFGGNMFFFPIEHWVGGVFHEHVHRLFASWVGLLTVILTTWTWLRESRPWVRYLASAACFLVVVQGFLGGLRVALVINELGLVHGILGQLFLGLTCAFAVVTSPWWVRSASVPALSYGPVPALRLSLCALLLLTVFQLCLGASMRHQHAALSIPDLPLAYGQLVPDVSPSGLDRINAVRDSVYNLPPTTPFLIHLQLAHRFTALLISVAAVALLIWVQRAFARVRWLVVISNVWTALVAVQFFLGLAVILTNKAADIATLHVVVGAAFLMTLAMAWVMSLRGRPARETAYETDRAPAGWEAVS